MIIALASVTTPQPEEKIIQVVEEPIVSEVRKINKPVITDPKEIIENYIEEICKQYKNVDPNLVKSIVYHESRYNPEAENGNCVGLMQVSTHWNADRAARLGVTNFKDPYSNILIGVDFLSELFYKYEDPALVLMLYNMKWKDAFRLHANGVVSGYAKSVLAKAGDYREGV
jgi:hypothetical protein